jgi:hypothetical protein
MMRDLFSDKEPFRAVFVGVGTSEEFAENGVVPDETACGNVFQYEAFQSWVRTGEGRLTVS